MINIYDFPHVELEKYSSRYPQEIEPRLGIDTPARTPGRPAIPPFQGEKCYKRLGLGGQLLNLL